MIEKITGLWGSCKLPLLGFGLVLIGLCVVWLKVENANLQIDNGRISADLGKANGTIAEQRGQIKEWQSSYAVLDKKTAEQNEAMNKLEADGKAAQQRAQEALKNAEAKGEYYQRILNGAANRLALVQTCSEAVAAAQDDLKGMP